MLKTHFGFARHRLHDHVLVRRATRAGFLIGPRLFTNRKPDKRRARNTVVNLVKTRPGGKVRPPRGSRITRILTSTLHTLIQAIYQAFCTAPPLPRIARFSFSSTFHLQYTASSSTRCSFFSRLSVSLALRV